MAHYWDDRDRYRRNRQDYDTRSDRYRSGEDRDWSDRTSDEMRSWLGDDDAERRRRMDDRNDRYAERSSGYYGEGGSGYGGDYEKDYGRHGRQGSSDRGWSGSYGGHGTSNYGSGSYGSGGYGYGRSAGYGGGSRYSGSYGGYGSGRSYGTAGYGGRLYGGRLYGEDFGPGRTARGYSDYGTRDRHGSEDRGFFERAGDEIASWFGDEEAERRRRMDQLHSGRGPKGYTRSDERIREDVNDRLTDDPHIDASEIEVQVRNGEVTLSGTVDERFAKRHAEDIAEQVSGVRHVQNNVRVNDRSSPGSTYTGPYADVARASAESKTTGKTRT